MGHQQKPKIIIDITWWIGFSLVNISSVGHLIDSTRGEAFVCVLLSDTFDLITLWRVLSKISSVFLWSVSFINHIYLLLAVLLTSVTENCPTFNQRWRQKSQPASSCITYFCCEIMCVESLTSYIVIALRRRENLLMSFLNHASEYKLAEHE